MWSGIAFIGIGVIIIIVVLVAIYPRKGNR